ncbi:DDB1- and CUL4-associated factor 8 isoform X2 [Solenopsis invicta]|uniref:DDB1- and CUL4-associated factor 8 isoform X2 n=1 Tax=Solenopsis invicta TaxID=13686 RepID=UPI00193E44DF|nr:DDB1- and CUL4-associated factor 8 isoform X2 [Solenopsis invicta]
MKTMKLTIQRTLDEDEEIPKYLMKEKPHHNWHVVQALANRQIGNSSLFQRRFYGSLSAVERLNRMCNLNQHQMRYVNASSFNRKGNLLASVADDLEVVIWDWNAGKKRDCLLSGHTKNMFYVKWLPLDVEYLMVTCAADGQVRLLDLDCNISIKLMARGAAQKLAMHPETPYLIFSVGDDARMLSIDTRSHNLNELLVNESPLTVPLTSIQFNPLNCNEFCVSGWSSYVRVYDCRNVSLLVYKLCPDHLTEIRKIITCVAYNYNGTEILATYHDEDLFDRLMSSPINAHRYQGHRNTKYDLSK